MLLNHIAAVLVFSGPLSWIGLWIAIDPAGITALADLILQGIRRMVGRLDAVPGKEGAEPDHVKTASRLRMRLRLAGVALVLFAIVI